MCMCQFCGFFLLLMNIGLFSFGDFTNKATVNACRLDFVYVCSFICLRQSLEWNRWMCVRNVFVFLRMVKPFSKGQVLESEKFILGANTFKRHTQVFVFNDLFHLLILFLVMVYVVDWGGKSWGFSFLFLLPLSQGRAEIKGETKPSLPTISVPGDGEQSSNVIPCSLT